MTIVSECIKYNDDEVEIYVYSDNSDYVAGW